MVSLKEGKKKNIFGCNYVIYVSMDWRCLKSEQECLKLEWECLLSEWRCLNFFAETLRFFLKNLKIYAPTVISRIATLNVIAPEYLNNMTSNHGCV